MKLPDLISALPAKELFGNGAIEIRGLAYHSQSVEEGFLFAAIRGVKEDGKRFIPEALARGAGALLLDAPIGGMAVPQVVVPDVREALARLASAFYHNPSLHLTLIGLTGTNGKTTTSYLIESILTAAGKKVGVIGTVNYRFAGQVYPAPTTTPESLDLQKTLRDMHQAGITHVVLEVSSHALDRQRVRGCDFDVALFTNLTRDHLDYHDSMENYFQAKRLLFTQCLAETRKEKRFAVINLDDTRSEELRQVSCGTLFGYGVSQKAEVFPERVEEDAEGIRGLVRTPRALLEIRSLLIGRHNLYNILAAVSVGEVLEISPRAISTGVEKLNSVPGRLERVPGGDEIRVFVDYAHTGDALERALETLRAVHSGRLIIVFGCGGDRDRGKRAVMGKAAALGSDLAVITSDNPRTEDPLKIIEEIEKGIKETGRKKFPPAEAVGDGKAERGYVIIPGRREAIQLALKAARPGDVVLIAGKGHEDYQVLGDKKIPLTIGKKRCGHWLSGGRKEIVNLTASEIGEMTKGEILFGDPFCRATGVGTDSRRISAGELFIPLPGRNFNGHDFMAEALGKGAAGSLVQQGRESNLRGIDWPGKFAILVPDVLPALGDLAHGWRRRHQVKVVAITGSNGKTTTKEMTAGILSGKYKVLKTEGNYNNLIGLPLMLLRLSPQHEAAVLEMGMSEPGEIRKLRAIAWPQVSTILNVGHAHLEFLGSREGIAKAKGELWEGVQKGDWIAVNADDPLVVKLAASLSCRKKTYGLSREADIRAEGLSPEREKGTSFFLVLEGGRHPVRLKTFGRHNVANALAAAALASIMEIDPEAIVAGLENFQPFAGRGKIMPLGRQVKIVDDSYNANPDSLRAAVSAFGAMRGKNRGLLVLGDMLELGPTSPEEHEKAGRWIGGMGFALLIFYGEKASSWAAGALRAGFAEGKLFVAQTLEEILEILGKNIAAGDWILIKGSRAMGLERIIPGLKNILGEG